MIGVTLAASFFALVACARTGIAIFWRPRATESPASVQPSRWPLLAPYGLFGLLAVLGVLSEPALRYAGAASKAARDRAAYVGAVLGEL